jgi:hypothetical protein
MQFMEFVEQWLPKRPLTRISHRPSVVCQNAPQEAS